MKNSFFNLDAVLAKFQTASDHAAAVVGGAFLDELLTELLLCFFVEKSDDKLFQGVGRFATFSAKINVCHQLGLTVKEARGKQEQTPHPAIREATHHGWAFSGERFLAEIERRS